jgi:hypothetical protein
MQINLLTYPRIYYTIGRWLGMVVYIKLEIFRAGPPQKRLRAYTQIKEKKAWAQA